MGDWIALNLAWVGPTFIAALSGMLGIVYQAGRNREAARWNRAALAAIHHRVDVLERRLSGDRRVSGGEYDDPDDDPEETPS
jgi:hypothetical protein